jgi:hypothetical protein
VRHLKLFNPLDDWYGMSPIEAGAYSIDQHNEAMAWMQALLQNSARPSGALVVSNGNTLSDDNFQRLKAQIEEQYSGSGNAGRPMLLEGGLDWKAMGLSPTDMGIIESKYSSARDVALALGVPPQLLGIPGDNTYSNYAEARLAFWEDTALPMLDYIIQDWNAWLAAPYGVEAVVSDGTRVMFEQGALPEDGPAPKLIESHDLGQIRGLVTERRNTDSGMEFTAKIAATAAGNDAVADHRDPGREHGHLRRLQPGVDHGMGRPRCRG